MTDIANLMLAVDSRQLVTATRALRQIELGALGAEVAAKRFTLSFAAFGRGMQSVSTVTGGLYQQLFSLKGLLAGVGVGLAARELVNMADAYTRLDARLKLVSTSAADQAERMHALFRTAQDTRSSFEDLVSTYVRLAGATRNLGLSGDDLQKVMRSISIAIQISGTTASEAQSGLIQLSQAMALGQLQGQDLRAVFEELPGILRVLEDASGKTRAELRKLAEDGKITSQFLIQSLLSQSGNLEKAFSQMPTTVGQSLTQLSNEFFRVTGEANTATKGTSGLVQAVEEMRKVVADPSFAGGMQLLLTQLGEMGIAAAKLVSKYEEIAHNASKLGASFGPAAAVIAQGLTGNLAGAYRTYQATQEKLDQMDKDFAAVQSKKRAAAERGGAIDELEAYRKSLFPSPTGGLGTVDLGGGGGLSKEYDRATQSIQKQIDAQRIDAATIGMMTEAAARYRTQQELLNAAREDGIKLGPEERARIFALADTYAKQADELQRMQEHYQQLQDVVGTVTSNMQNAFDTFVDTSKFSFDDMISSMLKDLDKLLFKLAVIDPLTKGLTSALSGSGGGLGSILGNLLGGGGSSAGDTLSAADSMLPGEPIYNAMGNVFSRGNVIPFARGGIIPRPTIFPMARGYGLAGEAGPEAIMPLRRGPAGRLGIESAGSGSVVNNVTIINKAPDTTVSKREQRNSNGGMDIEVIIDQVAAQKASDPGSALGRVLGRMGARQPGIRR
jgi:lambda family phage tail tape measure protein